MGTEGSISVVVLTVDVAGDRSADGDESGSGCHRHEPTLRNDASQQRVETDSGTDGDRAAGGIQFDLALIEADDGAAGVLGRVAVGAAQATGDHASIDVTQQLQRAGSCELGTGAVNHRGHAGCGIAPPGQ